jgi:hypothetical protein
MATSTPKEKGRRANVHNLPGFLGRIFWYPGRIIRAPKETDLSVQLRGWGGYLGRIIGPTSGLSTPPPPPGYLGQIIGPGAGISAAPRNFTKDLGVQHSGWGGYFGRIFGLGAGYSSP